MKKILIALAALMLFAGYSQAQIGTDVANFVFTNSAACVGALRGLSGDKYIVEFTYVKDITTNAGVLLTYDRAFTPHNPNANQTDMLNGGLTLKTSVYLLRRWNPQSNFKLDFGAYELAGTATSGPNNGKPVNVAGGYVSYENGNFDAELLLQNRIENDFYSGNYVGGQLGWRF